ncbi:MAG: hypothetical protein A3A58_00585 [Candidatus Blackburnbacteria bacterium RIFCSPLOWO2_01_FULL_41_27]|uniref:Uncharacterized protein n=2 Tax=Candidatus Blackburniibacteriota TaxID=1817898 RepID=A0A1G1VAC4_9BACT|nr:MAG: hypothetical protein A3F61_00450 [Candidatus Blackburnbacteria bacterium RIFCSPHIGHO2_12_FULL_41_13b]OGY15015.1 MAG: hypothetical protein A3A58_00585 [Candidatus Blackburnbacteria bacterium RIFCSPLOWO2_01_FULL_41_27]
MTDEQVTKEYLDRRLKLEFDEFEEKMDTKFTKLRSDIFDKIDGLAARKTKDEEEYAAHEFSHKRVDDDLSDLDKRVTVLEKGN